MTVGTEEGDRCNRINVGGFRCDGSMEIPEPSDCSCYISPPCGSCVDRLSTCTVCGATEEDEE